MRIGIACDHGGFGLKEELKALLKTMGIDPVDFGSFDETSVDYPDFGLQVAEKVSRGELERGILICGTGIGMCIAANKVRGVIAALSYDAFTALRARLHNDANVLCLGTREDPKTVREIIETFLTTDFEGGRHLRRLNKIRAMEC